MAQLPDPINVESYESVEGYTLEDLATKLAAKLALKRFADFEAKGEPSWNGNSKMFRQAIGKKAATPPGGGGDEEAGGDTGGGTA